MVDGALFLELLVSNHICKVATKQAVSQRLYTSMECSACHFILSCYALSRFAIHVMVYMVFI